MNLDYIDSSVSLDKKPEIHKVAVGLPFFPLNIKQPETIDPRGDMPQMAKSHYEFTSHRE